MRSRFLYFVLASALFHVAVLGFPFSVTTGVPGTQTMLPVRVHLLADGDEAFAAAAERTGESAPITEPERAPTKITPSPEVSLSTDHRHTETRLSAKEERQSNTLRAVRPRARPVTLKPTTTPSRVALDTPKARAKRETQAKHERQLKSPVVKTAESSTRQQPAPLRTTTVYPPPSSAQPSTSDAKATAGNRPASPVGLQSSSPQPNTFSRVRYARVIKPEYPEHARKQGWEGTTVLKVLVNPAGKSAKVRVQRTSGFRVLDNAAMDAMQQWEFHPARNEQKTVQSWVSVPIVFTLKEE